MSTFNVEPGKCLRGELRVPGDKSISHRSIIFGSLANGTTTIEGFLEGEDSLRTLQAFRSMGVPIEHQTGGVVTIDGVGLHGLKASPGPIDLGNSGTAMRLMAGILAGQAFSSTLIGDESLSIRPMGRVIKPLAQMGAVVGSSEGQRPPLEVAGTDKSGQPLQSIEYSTPVASAQIKSCLLLAGLYAAGETTVVEPGVTRDHTERMLRGFGIAVQSDYPRVSLSGGCELTATHIQVPADISSAAFFLVGASIGDGSDILLRDVGINPTRDGIIQILQLMGADIGLSNQREVGGEVVADIRVRSAELRGIDVPEELVPLAIDEFPALFVAATAAVGTTTVRGAEELRVKETDRIKAMVDGLKTLGADIDDQADGAVIRGREEGHNRGPVLTGGHVDSCGDHRIAMSFSMASLICDGDITISDCANVGTSFPGFVELAATAGLGIREQASRSTAGAEGSA